MLHDVDDQLYGKCAMALLSVRNSLLAFATAVPLQQRVAATSAPIIEFAVRLKALADSIPAFAAEISVRITQAAQLCAIHDPSPTNTFIDALDQIAAEEDWSGLEIVARRYSSDESTTVSKTAESRLALALAHSDDEDKRIEACKIVERRLHEQDATIADYELGFAINRRLRQDEVAESIILDAIAKFGALPASFRRAGYKFAAESGRNAIRTELDKVPGDHDE